MNPRPNQEGLAKYYADNPDARSKQAKEAAMRPERIELQRKIGREVFKRPDFQKKSLENRMKHPAMKPGPDHHSGALYRIRDPAGRLHSFRNMRNFIRENGHLFNPEDVIWVAQKQRGVRCRAMALQNLKPSEKRKRVMGQWKGWTWYSFHERVVNVGDDLLVRQPNK